LVLVVVVFLVVRCRLGRQPLSGASAAAARCAWPIARPDRL